MVKRYELSDRQWERIAEILPGKAGDPGRTGVDNRLFVHAVLWVLRSGAHWHDLPTRYGKAGLLKVIPVAVSKSEQRHLE